MKTHPLAHVAPGPQAILPDIVSEAYRRGAADLEARCHGATDASAAQPLPG